MNKTNIWNKDLTKILKKFYKELNINAPCEDDHYLIDLVEWLNRIPSRHSKKVHISTKLKNKILTPLEIKSLSDIKKISETGGDLRPYLGDTTKAIRNRNSKKIDLFSSAWRLLHLHLGQDLENKKTRVSRSRRVLIARFENEHAYFIDIVAHGRDYPNVWGDKSHLKILYKNWPHTLSKLNGIYSTSNEKISANDHIKARSAGLNMSIEFDGQVFIPDRGGISIDCSQIYAVRIASTIQEELKNAEIDVRQKEPLSKIILAVKHNSILNKTSVGFIVPRGYKYYNCYKNSQANNGVSHFFNQLLMEIPLKIDKRNPDYIIPRKIKY